MQIQVDPAILADSVHAYRRAAADVRETLGRLNQASGGLTKPGVLGSDKASADMEHLRKSWSDNLQRLATALDNIAGALNETLQEYIAADRSIVRMGGTKD